MIRTLWNKFVGKSGKVRQCCDRWSAYMKRELINNRVYEQKQAAEVKFYRQGL